MANDTFEARIDELARMCEPVYAYVNVDQVYARFQDGVGDLTDLPHNDTGVITPTEKSVAQGGKFGVDFDHPEGGEARYLSGYITTEGFNIVESLSNFIREDISLADSSIVQMEKVASHVQDTAPIDFGILANSASVHVDRNHRVYYDRHALTPRLSQSELDALRAHRLFTFQLNYTHHPISSTSSIQRL